MISSENIARLESLFAVLFKYEIHAFVLLLTGVALALGNHKEEGLLVIGGALGVFKNSTKQS